LRKLFSAQAGLFDHVRSQNRPGGSGHGTSELVLLSLGLVVALILTAGGLGSLLQHAIAQVTAWAANLTPP
jgi:hypothetical protein